MKGVALGVGQQQEETSQVMATIIDPEYYPNNHTLLSRHSPRMFTVEQGNRVIDSGYRGNKFGKQESCLPEPAEGPKVLLFSAVAGSEVGSRDRF